MPIIGNLSSAGKKPTTPTIGTATDGGTGTSANVAFTASSYIGKGTITYTALSNPGSITGTGSASPIAVSGLTTGTAYTFTVKGDTNYGVASDYSAASNSVTPASPSSYESISTVTVGAGGASSITFSSIPSTYTHLQIRMSARSDRANSGANTVFAYANGDEAPSATTNYYSHYLAGDGSSASAGALSSANPGYGFYFGFAIGANATNNISPGVIDILDYANTNKYKVSRSLAGTDNNGSGYLGLFSSVWSNTAAITSLKLVCYSYNFTQYSSFALYGIKG
jgi:hypothetical protein